MRQFFSITAIMALMSPLVSPLVALSCPHGKQLTACHRVQKQQLAQHCGSMAHEDPMERKDLGSEAPAIKAAVSQENCPMDCCVPGYVTNAAVVVIESPLPEMVVTDHAYGVTSVVFTSSGFSSHTDRGPPNS
jgi:hypothetical protein